MDAITKNLKKTLLILGLATAVASPAVAKDEKEKSDYQKAMSLVKTGVYAVTILYAGSQVLGYCVGYGANWFEAANKVADAAVTKFVKDKSNWYILYPYYGGNILGEATYSSFGDGNRPEQHFMRAGRSLITGFWRMTLGTVAGIGGIVSQLRTKSLTEILENARETGGKNAAANAKNLLGSLGLSEATAKQLASHLTK